MIKLKYLPIIQVKISHSVHNGILFAYFYQMEVISFLKIFSLKVHPFDYFPKFLRLYDKTSPCHTLSLCDRMNFFAQADATTDVKNFKTLLKPLGKLCFISFFKTLQCHSSKTDKKTYSFAKQ